MPTLQSGSVIGCRGKYSKDNFRYWKTEARRELRQYDVTADRPRPAVPSYRGARNSRSCWIKKVGDALKALSHQENVTLFMTLLAAFQLLLHRYTAQEEIVVGSPIAGRTRPELEDLIGFFVNSLVLRNDFSGNPSFKELLARVRQVCLDAYAHQDVPFEKLVETLRPERSLGQSPLFQIMFVLENTPKEALKFGDVAVTSLDLDTELAKYDLTVSMHEETEGLQAVFNYSADLFDGATITRMLGHFQTLLQGIVENPDQRISDLPILTQAERQQLLVEWNDTTTEYPRDKCIHQLFEEQVERTPDATAVVFEDQQLTYRELNKRANQLAHYLRKQGVGPEVLVGICIERSLEMIIGLLGILKAGAAYLPLDPSYPKERLAFMLEDSRASMLISQHRMNRQLPSGKWRTVALDEEKARINKEPSQCPNSKAIGSDRAYVIYTSGSIGQPKAVEITHYSLLNLVFWHEQTFAVTSNDRATQVTSPAFDAMVWELWPYLMAGASVYIPTEVTRLAPQALRDWLVAKSITISFLPTVLAEAIDGAAMATRDHLTRIADGGGYTSPLSPAYSSFRGGQQLRPYRMYCCGHVGNCITQRESGVVTINRPAHL